MSATGQLRGRLRAASRGRCHFAAAPTVLAPGGELLLVHSGLCGIEATLDALHAHGLHGDVVQEVTHPFGPVLTARAELLESRGLVTEGGRTERLVVIRAAATPATVPLS